MRKIIEKPDEVLHLCRVKRGNIEYYAYMNISEYLRLSLLKGIKIWDVIDYESV